MDLCTVVFRDEIPTMKFAIAGFIGLFLAGMMACSNEVTKKPRTTPVEGYYSDEYVSYRDCDNCDINIVKIRNCEYVLWHNGYGSDMEHYEGCQNIEHGKE